MVANGTYFDFVGVLIQYIVQDDVDDGVDVGYVKCVLIAFKFKKRQVATETFAVCQFFSNFAV